MRTKEPSTKRGRCAVDVVAVKSEKIGNELSTVGLLQQKKIGASNSGTQLPPLFLSFLTPLGIFYKLYNTTRQFIWQSGLETNSQIV